MSHPPVLCAFDAAHRHFVCVTRDNRIKLWDAITGHLIQQYEEDSHLAVHYTSIAWTLTLPSPPSKKKPTSTSPPLGHLALGSKTGSVSVFNLTTGECSRASTTSSSSSSDAPHSSPITAVAFHPQQGGALIAASADHALHRFAFPSLALLSTVAAPSPVTFLPAVPQSASTLLLALGPSLAVLDVQSTSAFTLQRKWAAVTGDICSVAASGDGKLYATASTDARFVHLWDAGAEVEERKKSRPIKATATLTLQAPATHVAITEGGESMYHVAVLEEHHTVNLFTFSSSSPSPSPLTSITLPSSSTSELASKRVQVSIAAHQKIAKAAERHNHKAEGKKKKGSGAAPMAASTAVESERGGGGGEEVLTVDFIGGREVIIVRGDRERVAFERVEYVREDGEWRGEVVMEKRAAGVMEGEMESDGPVRRKRSHAVTLLPNSSAPLISTVAEDTSSSKRQKMAASTSDASLAAPHIGPLSTLESTLPLLQRTLAERLAELEKRSGTFAGDVRVKDARMGEDALVPKAGSLQTLLTQALHTGDDALFEYCLSSSMATVLNSSSSLTSSSSSALSTPSSLRQTLQRLPSAYLLPLLTRLTSLLHSRPSRALPLLTWLHALLLTQTAWLLSQHPSTLHPAFSRLMGLLDSRVAAYKKMCRLQGKLEVIMAQVDGRRGGSYSFEDGKRSERNAEPKLRYIEGKGTVESAEADEEEKEEEEQKPERGSGKQRRRRRGAASASAPHRGPRPAQVEAAPATEAEDEEEDEEGAGMNGLNGEHMELEDDDEEDDE